ncbi:MAG: hypothetical protein ACUVUE_06755, partial [Candidatus Bathycorpusculaceae bacterium]
ACIDQFPADSFALPLLTVKRRSYRQLSSGKSIPKGNREKRRETKLIKTHKIGESLKRISESSTIGLLAVFMEKGQES